MYSHVSKQDEKYALAHSTIYDMRKSNDLDRVCKTQRKMSCNILLDLFFYCNLFFMRKICFMNKM